jgi:hypothetical protein
MGRAGKGMMGGQNGIPPQCCLTYLAFRGALRGERWKDEGRREEGNRSATWKLFWVSSIDIRGPWMYG